MTLETRTVRSIGWSATSQIVQLVMATLISAILARLLVPSDFGLIAMVLVFSNFAAIFSTFGLPSAIVQKKEVSDEALSSTFWINAGLGALLTVALAASAPLIAAFYSQPRLTPLVVFISTIFFIGSLNNVQTALLTKRMNFKALAIIGICATGISGPIAVLLAFSGYGVWSLAWVHGSFDCFFGRLNLDLCWMGSPFFAWAATRERAIGVRCEPHGIQFR